MREKLNISDSVMNRIHEEDIKMKPKIYFILGSVILFLSLALSIVASIFLFTIIEFMLRTHGPMGQIRLNELISNFPWWAAILGVLGIFISTVLLKKYDFSYKKNFLLIIILLIFSILLASFVIDYLNLDNLWLRQGPMKGIMRQYMQNNSDTSVPGTNGGRFQRGMMNNFR